MPRTVPSQIVAYIDQEFRSAIDSNAFLADIQFSGRIAALVRLVDQLPDELLTLNSQNYTAFIKDVETMRGMVEKRNATGKKRHF